MRLPFTFEATMEDGEKVTLLAYSMDDAISLFKERYAIGRKIVSIDRHDWNPWDEPPRRASGEIG